MSPITPLLVPLQGDFLSGINDAGGQAATSLENVGYVVVLVMLLGIVWKARGALAALFVGGLAASFGYWLVKGNGLAVLSAAWGATFAKFF